MGQGVAVPERGLCPGLLFSRKSRQCPAQPEPVGSDSLPAACPHPLCRADPPAEQEAGGLAALRQRPAGARALVRGLLLHAQGPAGEAEGPRTSLPLGALGHLASLAHEAPLTSCPATCPAPRTTPLSCLHLVGGWGTFGSQRVTAPQPMTLGVTVQVWTLLPRAPPPTEGRVPSPGAPNASYEGAGG